MRTFYEILGVPRNASKEEILAAYRRRCLETHPDRGGNETEFLNVRKGYEILSNDTKRNEYDKWVKAKEDIEKKNDIALIRNRVEPWFELLLNQYCKDEALKALIQSYYYRVDSIFININRAKYSNDLAAEIIKKILIFVREGGYNNIESVLTLDSICNDILLGRKNIQEYESVKTTAKVKESNKGNKGSKSGNLVAWLILFSAIGIILMICNSVPYKKTSNKINYKDETEIKYISKNHLKEEPIVNAENSEVYWLYNQFKEKGYSVGTYNEFLKSLHEKEIVDKYYNEGKKKGIIEGDRSKFYKIISYYTGKPLTETRGKNNTLEYKETRYKTGDCPYAGWYGYGKKDSKSLSELKILNYSSSEAVVLLESSYGNVIRHVYIKDNSTYTIKNIPEGKYRIKVMYGNSWNNEKDNGAGYPKGGFMKNVSFSKSKDNDLFDFMFERTYDGVTYPTYSITLHKVVNGNMKTENIDEDDFF